MLISDVHKILFILNTTATSEGAGLSGGDIRVYRILKFLGARYDCSIKGFFALKRMNEELGIAPGIIHRYAFYDRFSLYVSYLFRCFDALLSLLKSKKQFNIVYVTSDFFPDVIPAFYYKLTHRKAVWAQCVFHIYSHWRTRPGNGLINFLAQYCQRFSFFLIRRYADIVIVINSATRNRLIKMGFQPEKVSLGGCGVDIKYLDGLTPGNRCYEGLFLARLHPTKGIFDLVEIWKIVCARFPKARLAIIGGSIDARPQELHRRIESAGLDQNIDVLGYQEDDVAFKTLKTAKVFLFPSHEEGWGIVIAEAMACQVPVVSWNLPVYSDIYGDFITQVEENNVNLFARRVIDLLENDDLRKRIGGEAKDLVRKYDWSKIAGQEEQILITTLKTLNGGT